MKIVLIEDQNLLASTLVTAVQKMDDIEIVGRSDKASDSIQLCEQVKPDLVIMDIYTRDGNGIDYTARIKQLFPEIKVMVITGMADDRLVRAAEKAGADLFSRKDISLEELLEFIHYAHKPYRIFPAIAPDSCEPVKLSSVDIQIINLLAKGKSAREIAESLFISYGTVRLYISRMFDMTGVKSRAQLVAYALRAGLIERV